MLQYQLLETLPYLGGVTSVYLKCGIGNTSDGAVDTACIPVQYIRALSEGAPAAGATSVASAPPGSHCGSLEYAPAAGWCPRSMSSPSA